MLFFLSVLSLNRIAYVNADISTSGNSQVISFSRKEGAFHILFAGKSLIIDKGHITIE
jgi:hypothetical protein